MIPKIVFPDKTDGCEVERLRTTLD